MRAPFQVLVFLYRISTNSVIEYAIFKRRNGSFWQGIAGGGQNDEMPLEAALREMREETGIFVHPELLVVLQSMTTIPVEFIKGFLWGDEVLVIPEYCFGAPISDQNIVLSEEHSEYMWTDYETARNMLKWDSNRSALWELNITLQRKLCGY